MKVPHFACHSALGLLVAVVPLFVLAPSSRAANASVGLYTDTSGQTCSFSGNAAGAFSAYVVFRPDFTGATGVQFAAPVPSCLGAVYIGETLPPGALSFGNSQTGISIVVPCTLTPVSVLRIDYYRNGSTDACCPYPIVADPTVGAVMASDCAYQDVPTDPVTSHFNADGSCACVGNSAPTPPTNPDPFDGQAAIFVQPQLSWFADDWDHNIVSYDVYLGTSPSPPLVASGLTDPTYAAAQLPALTQHFWRVVVRDAMGLEQSGPVWSFTTRTPNTPPVAPYNPTPVDGAINVGILPTLQWLSADIDGDPLVYDVYFGTASPPPLVAVGLANPLFNPSSLAINTVYYWRVVARDGNSSGTSGPLWSFTSRLANLPPGIPVLVAPPSPSGQPISLTLDWTASDPDGDPISFDVYFGTSPVPPLVASNRTVSDYPVSGLLFSTQYYWHVVVRDAPGASTGGPTWTFTTRPVNFPPEVPSGPNPPNNVINYQLNVTLAWQCSDLDNHTILYDVYFGTTSPPPLVASNVETKSYALGTVAETTQFFWKIVARDQLGAETAGPIWSFTTRANAPPELPSSPIPSNASTNRPINSTLAWSCSDLDGDPVTYDVYFGTVSPPPLVANNIAVKSYAPGLLAFSTTYYWRILARDSHAHETSGPTWSFTTKANSPPVTPTSPSPSTHSVIGPLPVLTWSASDADPQPLTYSVDFGNTSPPPLVASGLTSPSYPTGLQSPPGQYFWRVTVSDGLASTQGPIWDFTLASPGDVVRDGVINAADAACAMQIYLLNPSCGGASGASFADVNCSGDVTPGDARCIHKFVVDGSCAFCGSPSAPLSGVDVALVSVGSTWVNEDTLAVRLVVSGISSLGAFGFDINSGSMKLLQVVRRGPTNAFTSLATSMPSAGHSIVGGYALTSASLGSAVEFVELRFDVVHGMPDQMTVYDFVDDLAGMPQLTIPLAGSVDVRPTAPGLVLNQNHPNPFNPQTSISYELPNSSDRVRVRMWILDISGRIVATLVNEEQSSGSHEVRWEGRDDRGQAVSSGVYFYVLDAGGERLTRKLVLLK